MKQQKLGFTQIELELNRNINFMDAQRDNGREHVFIHELPFPSRFMKSRNDHSFVGVRLGAIYLCDNK